MFIPFLMYVHTLHICRFLKKKLFMLFFCQICYLKILMVATVSTAQFCTEQGTPCLNMVHPNQKSEFSHICLKLLKMHNFFLGDFES